MSVCRCVGGGVDVTELCVFADVRKDGELCVLFCRCVGVWNQSVMAAFVGCVVQCSVGFTTLRRLTEAPALQAAAGVIPVNSTPASVNSPSCSAIDAAHSDIY